MSSVGKIDIEALHADIMRRYPHTMERLRLSELVDAITPENRHGEVDFGPPVGREFGGDGGTKV